MVEPAFILKNNINYIERHDLALNSTGNFESTVIEINTPKRKHLIVAYIDIQPQKYLLMISIKITWIFFFKKSVMKTNNVFSWEISTSTS